MIRNVVSPRLSLGHRRPSAGKGTACKAPRPCTESYMMDFYDPVRCMERDDWDGVAHLVLGPGTNSAAGTSFAICPDNTVHIAMPKVERSVARGRLLLNASPCGGSPLSYGWE